MQPHTADALRSRINQANAQAHSTPRQKPVSQDQTARHQNPDGAVRQTSRGQNPGQNSGQVRPVSQPVRQNPQSPVRQNPQTPVRQNPSVPVPEKTVQRPEGTPVLKQPSAGSVQQRSSSAEGMRAGAQNTPVNSGQHRQTAPASQQRRESMMRTKPVTPVKPQKKKEEYTGNDEGGNTVVSVVKAILYIVFVMIISVFLAMVIINVGNDVFAFVKSDELVEVTIPEYSTLDEVTDVLYRNDIIRYPTIFKIFAVKEKDDRKFVAGTYTVHGMMSYEDLLDAFKEKPVTGIKKITIPEGFTTDEIIDLFVAEGIGTREGFVDVIQNYEFDYWFIRELNDNGISEERIYRLDGYLFPDTYEFYLNSSEATVINKLLKRFSQIFTKEYREQSAAFGYTVDEVITLASIIEKEAASPSEFFIISSVFHNRMNNPWTFPKLESDATIVYQMQHESGERPQLTGSDLEVDLAYNTYTNDGLPPGPIANPSASAMLAALSPVTTNYYFFYHHKGTIYPSETKEQHNAVIAQFQNYTEQQTTGDVAAE